MRTEIDPREPSPDPGLGASAGRSILDELMTAEQIARMLQMRQSTVEDYARREVLPSVKVGRHRRFIRSEVEVAIGRLTEGRARR